MKRLLIIPIILLMSSLALAQEWSNDRRVTEGLSPELDPTVALDPVEQVIYLAFAADPDERNIFYKRLDYTGSPIGSVQRISRTNGEAKQPSLAVDTQRNVHTVWADADDIQQVYDLRYTKQDAQGNRIIDNRVLARTGNVQNPQIVTDSQNNAHIVWSDFRDGNWELYYEKLAADGTTLIDDRRLTTAAGTTVTPSVAVDVNNLYVTYEDNRDFDREIYFMKLDLSGTVLSDIRVTNARGRSEFPVISVDSRANTYIVYSDYRNGNAPQVFLAKVNAQGSVVFERPLTSALGWSVQPSLVVHNDTLHVVWQDHRDGNAEIYYQKLDTDGNLIGNVVRLTNNAAASTGPVIIADRTSNIHVIWHDFRDNAWSLYHKRTLQPSQLQSPLVIEGKPHIGSMLRFHIRGTPGVPYVAGISGSLGSSFGLGIDEIFQASVSNPSVVGLERSQGQFDKRGEEVVLLTIPRRSALVGQTFYFNYAVREEGRLRSVTEPVAFTVTA